MMDARKYQQLFEAYIEGTLTESQAQDLVECLRRDEALRARFLQEWELCNLLGHVTDDTDDTEEFIRSFWERIRAEETADQFASDFEKRKGQGALSSDLLEAIEEDEHLSAQRAAEEARTRTEAIRKATGEAFRRFMAEERRRQEELAYKLYVARRRRMVLGMGSLAALLVVVLCAWLLPPQPQPPAPVRPTAPPVVARITNSLDAQWRQTGLFAKLGAELTAGPIALDEGFVEITFRSDARLIIEAPAEINLVDEHRIRLDQGTLTAHVPEEARGFEVETPSARVTDLGTEFALAVDARGAMDVHVLDGWVAASFTAAGHDEQQRVKVLYQDHAMRFDARTGTMNAMAVDGERFARSWDDVLYKPRVDGSVRFERSTPASLCEDALEHDDFIRVILERTDVLLGDDMTVNIAAAGQYESFEGLSESLPAGARVDSYLLHWDPASVAGTRRIMSGRLTFRRPILGVIVTAEQLSAGDGVFGLSDTKYPAKGTEGDNRHLESASERQNADMVMLSADRLTLEVRLWAINLDQVRILVAAPSVEEG